MHTRFTRALVAVICCIVLVASCARLEVFATSTSNTKYSNLDSSKWNLVWSDEFSGDSVDTNKWSFTIGGGGFGNNEQQYYTDSTENAYIENGCLVLNAIQESNGEENYTSAKLSSTSSWTYGRYEFRAKLPGGTGLWPAIWMSSSCTEPICRHGRKPPIRPSSLTTMPCGSRVTHRWSI